MQNLIPALLSIWRCLFCGSDVNAPQLPYHTRLWPGGMIHDSHQIRIIVQRKREDEEEIVFGSTEPMNEALEDSDIEMEG